MEHGKRSGQGKYTWGASGAVYEGEYCDNRRQGLGMMTFPDKSRYEGACRHLQQCSSPFLPPRRLHTTGSRLLVA